jgi:hypothetical protein
MDISFNIIEIPEFSQIEIVKTTTSTKLTKLTINKSNLIKHSEFFKIYFSEECKMNNIINVNFDINMIKKFIQMIHDLEDESKMNPNIKLSISITNDEKDAKSLTPSNPKLNLPFHDLISFCDYDYIFQLANYFLVPKIFEILVNNLLLFCDEPIDLVKGKLNLIIDDSAEFSKLETHIYLIKQLFIDSITPNINKLILNNYANIITIYYRADIHYDMKKFHFYITNNGLFDDILNKNLNSLEIVNELSKYHDIESKKYFNPFNFEDITRIDLTEESRELFKIIEDDNKIEDK